MCKNGQLCFYNDLHTFKECYQSKMMIFGQIGVLNDHREYRGEVKNSFKLIRKVKIVLLLCAKVVNSAFITICTRLKNVISQK